MKMKMKTKNEGDDRDEFKLNYLKSKMDYIFTICNGLSFPLNGKRRNQDTNDMRPTKTQKLSVWSKSSTMTTSSCSQSSTLWLSHDRSSLSSSDNAFKSHGLGLNLQKLETLLCETSSIYCTNKHLVDSLHCSYNGIAAKKNHSPDAFERQELQEIADALKDILNDAPRMPIGLVANTHSKIGLIRQHLREYESSIDAFTKSLWLLSSMSYPNWLDVGVLLHRIGIVRSQMGCKYEANKLFEKALSAYRYEGLNENHSYVISAKLELQDIR
jgi:hypothetical protein